MLNTIQPFVIMFAALLAAFMTAVWISVIIWTFRDIRSRSRDVFAQILATVMVLLFFPVFPFPGLVLYMLLRPRETLSEVYERSLEEEALLQGIEERLACPGCNRRIEETFMVCPTCHTRLKKACPACGQLLHLRWNICPYCGAIQSAAKAATLTPPPLAVPLEPGYETPQLSSFTPSSLSEPEGAQAEIPERGKETLDDGPDAEAETPGSVKADLDDGPDADTEPEAETLPFDLG